MAIGDITIDDVAVGVAAVIAANVCPDVTVKNVGILARIVDRSEDGSTVVCEADTGDVVFTQN